jgi:hypothetical protein
MKAVILIKNVIKTQLKFWKLYFVRWKLYNLKMQIFLWKEHVEDILTGDPSWKVAKRREEQKLATQNKKKYGKYSSLVLAERKTSVKWVSSVEIVNEKVTILQLERNVWDH